MSPPIGWSVGSLARCDFCGRTDTTGARCDRGCVCIGCVALASDVVMFAEELGEDEDAPPPPTLACTVCRATGVRHLVSSDAELAGGPARLCDACIAGASKALAGLGSTIVVPGSDDTSATDLDPPSGITKIKT